MVATSSRKQQQAQAVDTRTLEETFYQLAENAHMVKTIAWLQKKAAEERDPKCGYYQIKAAVRTMGRKDAEWKTWRQAAKLAAKRGA